MNTSKIKNAPIQDESDNPSSEDELKKQYHPAFCAAMELELREDKDHLIFEDKYNLNTKPNKIDFLVYAGHSYRKAREFLCVDQ